MDIKNIPEKRVRQFFKWLILWLLIVWLFFGISSSIVAGHWHWGEFIITASIFSFFAAPFSIGVGAAIFFLHIDIHRQDREKFSTFFKGLVLGFVSGGGGIFILFAFQELDIFTIHAPSIPEFMSFYLIFIHPILSPIVLTTLFLFKYRHSGWPLGIFLGGLIGFLSFWIWLISRPDFMCFIC